ncbi:MAG: CinA family protein [Brevefilum sp.]|nr:CinA family protein [Brevefilum sp.]MDT8382694.1 CinA family protein [Brevefilum sp.]MDW7755224.1 CinA family protein [Brevefilum sp.]
MSKTSQRDLLRLSSRLGCLLNERGLSIATAESCTGGLLSHILTGVSGSSGYFIGGVVAYSNHIKEQFLGVSENTLIGFGAVSEQSAIEMAKGIAEKFNSSIGLSTTGIAGPSGGTPEKPVGLVWIGFHINNETRAFECHFKGERNSIKADAVQEILTRLLNILDTSDD